MGLFAKRLDYACKQKSANKHAASEAHEKLDSNKNHAVENITGQVVIQRTGKEHDLLHQADEARFFLWKRSGALNTVPKTIPISTTV